MFKKICFTKLLANILKFNLLFFKNMNKIFKTHLNKTIFSIYFTPSTLTQLFLNNVSKIFKVKMLNFVRLLRTYYNENTPTLFID